MFYDDFDDIDVDDLDNVVDNGHDGSRKCSSSSRSQFENSRLHRAGTVCEDDTIAAECGDSCLARNNLTAVADHRGWIYDLGKTGAGSVVVTRD